MIKIEINSLKELQIICDILEEKLDKQVKTRKPTFYYDILNRLCSRLRNTYEDFRDIEREKGN